MTLPRIAFWFGFLELGFVLRSGGAMGANVFLLWAGAGCLCLMWPHTRERLRQWVRTHTRYTRDAPGTDGW